MKDNKKLKQTALTTPCSHTTHLIHSSLKHLPISWETLPYCNSNVVIGIHNNYKKTHHWLSSWSRTKSQPIKQLSFLTKSCLYCTSLILVGISYPYITELYCNFTYSTTSCHCSSQWVVSCWLHLLASRFAMHKASLNAN